MALSAVSSGYRESTQSWSAVLLSKERGTNPRSGDPKRASGDLGSVAQRVPRSRRQRCWNHRIVNLLAKIPKSRHKAALLMLRQIPHAETREPSKSKDGVAREAWRQRLISSTELGADVTFYNYPKQQWQHLRTANPVESPLCSATANRCCSKVSSKVATHGRSSGRSFMGEK